MTHHELSEINLKYKKNPDDITLLLYIPRLLTYINELHDELSGMNHYWEELDI